MREEIGSVAVIGFGAIGTPLSDALQSMLGEGFHLIADGDRADAIENERITVNGRAFVPSVLRPSSHGPARPLDLVIVCVKNYSLEPALNDIERFVSPATMILPLQNGVYAYERCKERFPDATVLRGYIQGPNTRRRGNAIRYSNPGVIHFGSSSEGPSAVIVERLFRSAGIEAVREDDIERMVWKKWMLNVAGNTVTALTSADYSDFRMSEDLVYVCRASMNEFLEVAAAGSVILGPRDVEDTLTYFRTYVGSKRTSMLEDVIACRRTENEYLAGELVRRAHAHGIEVPVTETLYRLMRVKETLYRNGRSE